jgi:hypothetical protein
MRARLVSMAEVTKPTLLEAELGKMESIKSPWTRITRRMMEVMVTLWGGEWVSGLWWIVEGDLQEAEEEHDQERNLCALWNPER